MVSPFAAYEDERRRRARLALRLPPDAPPELVDALIAKVDSLGGAPAAVADPSGNPFAAFLNRARGAFQRPEPPPDVNPQLAPYDYFAGWDETPGQTPIRQKPRTDVPITTVLGALASGVFPESIVAAGLGATALGAAGEAIAGERGRRLGEAGGEFAGYTLGPGSLTQGFRRGLQTAALSGGGAALGGEVAGEPGKIVGAIGAPFSPAAGRLAVRGSARLATEMGKTNVGNVLLPRAPQRVAQPLIYEGITPAERRILHGAGLTDADIRKDVSAARDLLYGPTDASGRRPGNIVSPEDTSRIQDAEETIGNMQLQREASSMVRSSERGGGLQDLIDDGLLYNLERSEKDPTAFRWRGKGLDEVFQSLPESDQNALPRFDATGREINDVERMVLGMKQITQSQRGSSTRASSSLRGEIESTVAKYAPEPEVPKATGPIAQAGFGGEMGPGQVARGAAERAPMTQAPMSEIAASEADRIAQARAARQTPSAPAAAALTEQAASSPPARPLSAPRSVATSRPRYRDVEPRFESDFDKAVYIVTNPGASVRHPEILAWVQSAAPKGFDLPGAGRAVRASIKSLYQPSQPLNVPMQNVTLRADR